MGCSLMFTACNIVNVSSSINPTTATTLTSVPTSETTTLFSNTTANYFEDAPVIITAQSDVQEFHVNLVKFTGSVPSPQNTQIYVNDTTATINADGSYYAYLDLTPGKI